jgi:hypothetical protein
VIATDDSHPAGVPSDACAALKTTVRHRVNQS